MKKTYIGWFIAISLLAGLSFTQTACSDTKANKAKTNPSEGDKGKKNKGEGEGNGKGDTQTTENLKITAKAENTVIEITKNEVSKVFGTLEFKFSYSYKIADKKYQRIVHKQELTSETNYYQLSTPYKMQNNDEVQVASILTFDERKRAATLIVRAYNLNLVGDEPSEILGNFEVRHVNHNDNLRSVSYPFVDLDDPDRSEYALQVNKYPSIAEYVQAYKRELGVSYTEMLGAEEEWSKASGNLTTRSYINSTHRDSAGNLVRKTEDSLFIHIPADMMNVPEGLNEYDLALFQMRLYRAKWTSTTEGLSTWTVHDRLFQESNAGDTVSNDIWGNSGTYGGFVNPIQASFLDRRYSNINGIFAKGFCITDACEIMQFIVTEELTHPEKKQQVMGAYEFKQVEGSDKRWEMTAHSLSKETTLETLSEEISLAKETARDPGETGAR